MTLLQIQYAIACMETGSISKAAQAMFTSASNLSRTIKALEMELGFEIFTRGANGITPTPTGDKFLKHAASIQTECNRITQLHESESSRRFSCACMHLPYCFMAFQALCRQYEKEERISLSLHTGFLSECIEAVAMRQCELGIISMPRAIDATERDYIEGSGLTIACITQQTLNINLRKGHPALADYVPGQVFDFSRLQEYPYISYSNYDNHVIHPLDLSHHSYFPLGAINLKKSIHINSADWKSRLIGSTNAFGIGTTGPEALSEAYNWECIPLPGYVSCLYYIRQAQVPFSEEAENFLSLLREILKTNPC